MTLHKTRKAFTALMLATVLLGGTASYAGSTQAAAPDTIQGKVTEIRPARTHEEKIAEWEAWAADHAYKLDTIQPVGPDGKPDSFKDLEMLKPLLQDKRFVFLGESSHGVAEFNLAKTRLIQFLHQEMGYNVLAFESGLAPASIAFGKVSGRSAEQTMKDSIFGVWWSKETLPLFDYIKASHNSEQPLVLTGFDMQLQFPLLDGGWLKDKALAKRLADADKKLSDHSVATDAAAYRKEKKHLISVYKEAQEALKTEANQAHIKQLYPDNPKLSLLLERALGDRIRVAEEYVELSIESTAALEKGDYMPFLKTMEWRDQAMHDNLMWLATEAYPTEKFIVWGHNDHIRKAQTEVMGSPYPVKLMGEMLSDEVKKYSYVLGLYPASGKTADNTGAVHDVLPPEPGSVESILAASGAPYTFMDLRYRSHESGNSWMFEPRFAYSWGMIPESLIARDQYDGILLIDDVNPPQYLRSTASSKASTQDE
ncbi:erythromycin esterase family protein [Paenibacillus lactis]|uniref:erythromycin esterase family protein n=1 Tax=Paenibacillus lactis TaxID=228574 RepID=UPI002040ADCF|nr:erythromycin esterase family protein [Paenibacillus lactis]MCM3494932.1 erythromycin esterase family protein [Paenibacillus lactis]